MKKLLCVFLAMAMICFTPVYITADDTPEQTLVSMEPVQYYASEVKTLEDYVSIDVLKETLAPQFDNFATTIDVSALGIPFTMECHSAIINFVCEEMSEYFYVSIGSARGYKGGKMVSFEVNNICTAENYAEYKAKWDAAVDKMLDGIRGNDNLTDVQKALLIHDRLVVHCEYDKERLDNNTLPTESYMAYGALVNRISVCEGYAEAYTHLLNLVGIESYLCSSDQIRHEWNIVKIDGEYYHVDVTYDDPLYDMEGRVSHDNFLLSSPVFSAGHKGATDFDFTPTSTTYDNYFWRGSEAAFQLIGDEIYYIDKGNQTINTYDGTVVRDITTRWYAGQYSFWPGHYSRTAVRNGKLLVSMPDAIYEYDTEAKTFEKLIEPYQDFGEYFSIYGMTYEDGIFTCVYNQSPNYDINTKKNYSISFELNVYEALSLSGKVTTYNPRVPAIIELKSGDEVICFLETETSDNGDHATQTFTFNEVADGTYDLVITKAGHLPYYITGIVVSGESVDLTTHTNPAVAEIVPLAGNTNGDLVIDLKDVMVLTADDTYNRAAISAANAAADINGDGVCDLQDLMIITSDNNYNKGALTVEY